jgi:hypothetical protein
VHLSQAIFSMIYKVVLTVTMAAALMLTPASMARGLDVGSEDMALADDVDAGRKLLGAKIVTASVTKKSSASSKPEGKTSTDGSKGSRSSRGGTGMPAVCLCCA